MRDLPGDSGDGQWGTVTYFLTSVPAADRLPLMPRVARIVLAGLPHHVTQRGNNQQDVFFVDDDRRVYLELLAEQAVRFGLAV